GKASWSMLLFGRLRNGRAPRRTVRDSGKALFAAQNGQHVKNARRSVAAGEGRPQRLRDVLEPQVPGSDEVLHHLLELRGLPLLRRQRLQRLAQRRQMLPSL